MSPIRARAAGLSCLLALVAIAMQEGANAQPAATAVHLSPPALAALDVESNTELARKTQNPVADLISLPFQNNLNFNAGPHRGVQDTLNIQPIIPFHINEDWNLITRTVVPLEWNPSAQPAASVPFGTGPVTVSVFLSPKAPTDGWYYGIGPITQMPTITSKTLGSNMWGMGPAIIIVKQTKEFVFSVIANNVFSVSGTPGPTGSSYSLFYLNPTVNYNFGDGWFVSSSPIITANWNAHGEKWSVPMGGSVGHVFKLASGIPVAINAGAQYYMIRPQYGPTWLIRTQVNFLF